ncbi:Response regulator of zinc sigma-54-dependent two-component system [Thermogutta terrifontis]|uniref:Response regulator of zinc sigma-54-dependent two-component system n=2 Tax=Thermogutta terrifontis TaxID=1331910 RepID=A0A286RA83_9BACT|nr:Response regulator of zinc sigma-54-dependent two-component system [Thermogutta terrifontis]
MYRPSLLVVSGDREFISQLESALAWRFAVMPVAKMSDVSGVHSGPECIAVVLHVHHPVINGYSVSELSKQIQQLATVAPVVAVFDREVQDAIAECTQPFCRSILDRRKGVDELVRTLAAASPLEWDLADFYLHRPHAVLAGKTRCWTTFTPAVFPMVEELRVAAAHDVTLLLIGETGAGKTFLARTIHELSPRAGKRFLTVACGALPPDLIESELFGYVKGAFTGADVDKPGKFAAAEDGTLLLDEIDVLAPDQQAKLLRVIETGEYEPVGSNETRISRARLIVASNVDLAQLVEQGKFRRDLYYRLNMLSFFIPPLRERPFDVEYLARKFAIQQARSLGIPLRGIEPAFLAALRNYSWPGNVRELENIIRRAVLYCRDGVLRVNDLPSMLRPQSFHELPVTVPDIPVRWTLEKRLEEAERQILEETLRRHGYRRIETARELGISRITLYHKMKKYGLLRRIPENSVTAAD